MRFEKALDSCHGLYGVYDGSRRDRSKNEKLADLGPSLAECSYAILRRECISITVYS